MNAPNFVGRQAALNEIEAHVLHIMTARPRVLLIEGLAGMGKTRLVEQIEDRANPINIRIAVGRCDEDRIEPYAPFRSLLSYFEDEQIVDDRGSSFLHVLTGRVAPSVNVSNAPTTEPAKVLFMNLTQALITLASRGPLIFIVEDLHWADPSTLSLFDYLAFGVAEQTSAPLLLIGTHRPVESETRLGNLIGRLQPENVARSLKLTGLDEAETREFLRALGVRRPTQQLVQTILETTQGVPLFIEEAVGYLIRQGALIEQDGTLSIRTGALLSVELPQDLTNAISGRLQALPPACQFPLTLAALLGETFNTDVLEAILVLDREELEAAIETAIEYGVVLREGARFRFAHPLLRHAFYNRLEPTGRRRYHLQVARTLETLYADDLEPHILDIAHHLIQAGHWLSQKR